MALTDTFIDVLRRDSYLQSVQSQFTDQQLLDIAWEQLVRRMAPVMVKARPTFFREVHDIALVADQGTYDIPQYAMWNKLHLASILGSTGLIARLVRRDPAEDVFFAETTSGMPHAIRLHDKQIEIIPAPTAGDVASWPTLRTYIYRRPGRLVRATDDGTGNNPARAAQVLSNVAGTITYTRLMPSDFNAASEHDFYSRTSPYRRVGSDIVATGAPDTSSQTFATDDAALVSAGDYVCLLDETCFLPIPVEMFGHLKDLTIRSLAKTQADQDMYQAALEEMKEDVATLFQVTVDPLDENPKTVTLLQSPFLAAMRRTRNMVRS